MRNKILPQVAPWPAPIRSHRSESHEESPFRVAPAEAGIPVEARPARLDPVRLPVRPWPWSVRAAPAASRSGCTLSHWIELIRPCQHRRRDRKAERPSRSSGLIDHGLERVAGCSGLATRRQRDAGGCRTDVSLSARTALLVRQVAARRDHRTSSFVVTWPRSLSGPRRIYSSADDAENPGRPRAIVSGDPHASAATSCTLDTTTGVALVDDQAPSDGGACLQSPKAGVEFSPRSECPADRERASTRACASWNAFTGSGAIVVDEVDSHGSPRNSQAPPPSATSRRWPQR